MIILLVRRNIIIPYKKEREGFSLPHCRLYELMEGYDATPLMKVSVYSVFIPERSTRVLTDDTIQYERGARVRAAARRKLTSVQPPFVVIFQLFEPWTLVVKLHRRPNAPRTKAELAPPRVKGSNQSYHYTWCYIWV
jgi:hypothetical protein